MQPDDPREGDMDDTTGSNGGSLAERSDDDIERDSADASRSDSARVNMDDPTGSTGDSATEQSAGRSQY